MMAITTSSSTRVDASEPIYRHCLKTIELAGTVSVCLESEWALAGKFGVSRRVARRALQRLVREGRAVARRGQGYFSLPPHPAGTATGLRVALVYEPAGRAYTAGQQRYLAELSAALARQRLTASLLGLDRPSPGSLRRTLLSQPPSDAYVLYSVSPPVQAFFAAEGKPAVVLGNTIRELDLPSVTLNVLEVTRELCEGLLSAGHQRVCLVQEKDENLGHERSRVGFVYAHHAQRARFTEDRIIRIDRRNIGARRAMDQLFRLAPSAMLVENDLLVELIRQRAGDRNRAWWDSCETIVLHLGYGVASDYRAKGVEVDSNAAAGTIATLLRDAIGGRSSRQQHLDIPWKLSTG